MGVGGVMGARVDWAIWAPVRPAKHANLQAPSCAMTRACAAW
jgi:hypothetical protein